jgi:hypothetical protein
MNDDYSTTLFTVWNLSVSFLLWISTFTRYIKSWPVLARTGFVLLSLILLAESVTLALFEGQSLLYSLGLRYLVAERVALTLIGVGLVFGIGVRILMFNRNHNDRTSSLSKESTN